MHALSQAGAQAAEAVSPVLAAITAAACLLPGLVPGLAQAQVDLGDTVAAQVSRYQEGVRSVPGAPNTMPALGAETLQLRGSAALARGAGLTVAYQQDSWSGATPVATAPGSARANRPVAGGAAGQLVTVGASPMLTGSVLLDRQLRPVQRGADGGLRADTTRVHTLASASPESRQQLDLRFTRPAGADDDTLSLGAGVSVERDFRSRTLTLGRRLAFDERRDTLDLTLAHTRSDIAAALDHDAAPYITKLGQDQRLEQRGGQQVLRGRRDEWSAAASWVRLLGPGALMEARLAHQRGRGDLNLPYKLTSVIFVAPEALAAAGPGEAVPGNLQALLERRPSQRRQWQLDGRLVLHHAASDGALHLGAGLFRDDWGVRAQRLEAEWLQPLPGGWMAASRVRYYSQRAASFYTPWLVSAQAYRRVELGPDGQPRITPFDPALLPAHFSSDARLAGFGSLGGGLSVSRPLGRGLVLELGLDLGRQSARLQAGGRRTAGADATGDAGADVTDLRWRVLHAGLRWQVDGLNSAGVAEGGQADAAAAHPHHAATGLQPPPSLMPLHEAMPAGGWMLGYGLQLRQDGSALQRGGRRLDEAALAAELARACGSGPCLTRPAGMAMRMHMVEWMRSLGDGWQLMLMPQWMSMQMDMQLVPGAVAGDAAVHVGRHESTGLGDTAVQLLWQPAPEAGMALDHSGSQSRWQSRWQWGLGLSLPTGDSGLRQRRSHQQPGRPLEPAMQPGSGSWDWLPRVAWQVDGARFSAGWQASAVLRPGWRAREAWRLGHQLQLQAWVAVPLGSAWQASARLGQRWTGPMRGEPAFAAAEVQSPGDLAANQGGQLTDLGLGLRWAGWTTGASLALEWQQPLRARWRGVQPVPGHGLVLRWQQAF